MNMHIAYVVPLFYAETFLNFIRIRNEIQLSRLFALYGTFWNLINIITRHDCLIIPIITLIKFESNLKTYIKVARHLLRTYI